MNVLLIQPKQDTQIFRDLQYPPLGLAYLASVLRNAGHKVTIFDGSVHNNPLVHLKEILHRNGTHVVGISATTPLMKSAFHISTMVKEANQEITVVLGGVHPTVCSNDVIGHPHVDYVVCGEGEHTMLELVEAIENGDDGAGIQGLLYKNEQKVIINEPRPLVDDLDLLPFPAYDLLPIDKYNPSHIPRRPYVTMITSRGCPYSCVFCAAHVIFKKKYRYHSTERTIEEIKYLIRDFGIREVLFKDSDFTLVPSRVEKICESLLNEEMNIRWSCGGRIGNLDYDMLKKMHRAGCRQIDYGVESGDPKILKTLDKRITVEEIRETFRITKKAGITTLANMLVGSPGESKESIGSTIMLLKEIEPDFCSFNFPTPFPGSRLMGMAIENDWLPKDFDPLEIAMDAPVMNATELTDEELVRMKKKMYTAFYYRPSYILRRLSQFHFREWKRNLTGLRKIWKL
jgi:anaerobic magnesium-protoporphyrin IX monomethyl ester cyclase